jgi:hypothetical protein
VVIVLMQSHNTCKGCKQESGGTVSPILYIITVHSARQQGFCTPQTPQSIALSQRERDGITHHRAKFQWLSGLYILSRESCLSSPLHLRVLGLDGRTDGIKRLERSTEKSKRCVLVRNFWTMRHVWDNVYHTLLQVTVCIGHC